MAMTERERIEAYNEAKVRDRAAVNIQRHHIPVEKPFADVPEKAFGGDTYKPPRDGDRLRAQLARVQGVMQDGAWRTLAQVAVATGDPEASVSARLRDLRKDKFGGHTVEREFVSKGLWRYRLTLRQPLA